jgi:RNA polymerase sigma-70 factor (ECF subfamily)
MSNHGSLAADDEAALIAGCRSGTPEAQRAVFDRYRDRVHAIALHFLKGDEAAAQDVSQEVFVRFFKNAPGFRADARLGTYLYRAVANACTDELRRRRRFVFVGDIPEALHPQAAAPSAGVDPEIQRAVHSLSPKLRLVVLMRYYDDLSYDEIAAALGVTAGTVASRLSRAHEQLARLLGPARSGGRDAA